MKKDRENMTLEISHLTGGYSGIPVIKDVNLTITSGEAIGLIGLNGAGKSTILKTISGLLKPANGEIVFLGQSLAKLTAPKIVAAGVSQVPEGRRIFAGMTVKENLQLGAYLRKDKDGVEKDMEAMFKRFPILKERQKQDAATLSGGEQQMLAMARALMARPKLLLLDEPSMGLAPIYIQEIFDIIKSINKEGMTVLLIEQNARQALSIANRGYVLASGEVKMTGSGQDLLNDPAVQKAYLGG